jgi:hypothetical protein
MTAVSDIVIDPWMTQPAAAKYLSMSVSKFRRRCARHSDRLGPQGNDGCRPLWRRSQLDAFVRFARNESAAEVSALDRVSRKLASLGVGLHGMQATEVNS